MSQESVILIPTAIYCLGMVVTLGMQLSLEKSKVAPEGFHPGVIALMFGVWPITWIFWFGYLIGEIFSSFVKYLRTPEKD